MQVFCEHPKLQSLPAVSFSTLMELYEGSYLRFRKLAPDFEQGEAHQISLVAGALDLHLHVLERTRFTATLRLTYQLSEGGGVSSAQPDILFRLYRDAHQVEALVPPASNGHYLWDDQEILLSRWKMNRFLYKWLGYCLEQGHRFSDQQDAQADLALIEALDRQLV